MMSEQPMDDLGAESDAPFILKPRKRSVPGQLRTARRVALLAVILSSCRESKATLPQLHVLNWAVRTKESRTSFLQFVRGFIPPDAAVVRFDPSLPRTIEYAFAEGIIVDRNLDALAKTATKDNYQIRLTEKGQELSVLVEDDGLLVDERMFLADIGRKISQTLVQSLLDWS